MAIKKKSLIGAATGKKAPDKGSGKSAANPAPAKSKKLSVAKVATAKLSSARLATLRKLY